MMKLFAAAIVAVLAFPVASYAQGVGFGVTIGRDHDQDRYRDRQYREHRRQPVIVIPDRDRERDRQGRDSRWRNDRGNWPAGQDR